MDDKEKSEIDINDWKGQYYINLLACLFNYGEREGIVTPLSYKNVSDKLLEQLPVKARDCAKGIAAKVWAERKINNLNDENLDDYIKKYLHTSDTLFVVDAVQKGMGVFDKLSNPKAKKYISKKKKIADRINSLSIEDLKGIQAYYENVKSDLGGYSFDKIREYFPKRIIIGKEGYSEQYFIDEESMINDIEVFLKLLQEKIDKKQKTLYYEGKVVDLSSEDKIVEFINEKSSFELSKFLLENIANLKNYSEIPIFEKLIDLINSAESERILNCSRNNDIYSEIFNDCCYQGDQIKYIISILTDKLGEQYTWRGAPDIERIFNYVKKDLWSNEEYRKKYYLPELDDLIINYIASKVPESNYNPFDDKKCMDSLPFEIKLRIINSLNDFSQEDVLHILANYNDENDGDNKQFENILGNIIDKLPIDKRIDFIKRVNSSMVLAGRITWLRNTMYSKLLSQLTEQDVHGKPVIITDENHRKFTIGLIDNLLSYEDDELRLPDYILKELNNLRFGLKNITLGEKVYQNNNPTFECSTEKLVEFLFDNIKPGEVSQQTIKSMLKAIVNKAGCKVILSPEEEEIGNG